nr:MAG TPA: hypothetical protein [Caudoviricetes sp.]
MHKFVHRLYLFNLLKTYKYKNCRRASNIDSKIFHKRRHKCHKHGR